MESKKTKRTMAKSDSDVAIAQKDIQIAVYAREIEAQAGEIRALRSELGKAKAAADSERAAHDAKMADCRNKVSSLEAEASRIGKTLSEERAAAHAAQERFLSEIESMRKGNADVMARLTAAESGKEALSADKANLQVENARIAEECRATREALERSLSDAESLRKGNADAMARLAAAESEKSSLLAAAESEKSSLLAAAESEKSSLLTAKEALSADKAKLLAENARMDEECRAAREALDRSHFDVEFLREGNRSLMSRLENADSEKSVLSSANEKLVADNNRLSNELGAARAYGKDQAAKLSAEKTASAQFKQKADSRYVEIEAYKSKLKKAQDAEASARRKAESVGRQLSSAKMSLRACREREDARRLVKRFHRLVKAVLPYGLVCTWKRMAYGIVEDMPLFYYPGFMKRTRRVAKFSLPYFAVAAFKRAKYRRRH